MTVPVNIKYGATSARVTDSGELVVAPLEYDESAFNVMDTTNAYNFSAPIPNKRMVITGFVAAGARNVSPDEAILEIYEADSPDTATVSKTLVKLPVVAEQITAPTPLRISVREGKWVNAKTDVTDIYLTLFGYYIDA